MEHNYPEGLFQIDNHRASSGVVWWACPIDSPMVEIIYSYLARKSKNECFLWKSTPQRRWEQMKGKSQWNTYSELTE